MYHDLEPIRQFCAYQERCHTEVRQKLYLLKYPEEDIEEIIVEMIQEGFLNEERFARSYCRGKFTQKKWGRNRIVHSLKSKQISATCIQAGLQEIDEHAYAITIATLLDKKCKELKQEKNEYKKRQKAIAYLLGKGYEYPLIVNAWDQREEMGAGKNDP